MKTFSIRTGLWTLTVYTVTLSLLAIARGSTGSPGFMQRVILVALSGFLVGYFLDPLARVVHGSFWKRFGTIFLIIFSLGCVSNVLETILYLPAIAIAGTIGGGFIQAIILAATLVGITKPSSENKKTDALMFSIYNRTIFVIVLALIWIPIYFFFEALDTPIVHFLENNSRDLFSHPALGSMLGLEFIRGIVHALVLLIIVILARGNQKLIWLWGSLAIAIFNGWVPILPTSTLPFGIRIANGVEITLSSIALAGIASFLYMWLKNHEDSKILRISN